MTTAAKNGRMVSQNYILYSNQHHDYDLIFQTGKFELNCLTSMGGGWLSWCPDKDHYMI